MNPLKELLSAAMDQKAMPDDLLDPRIEAALQEPDGYVGTEYRAVRDIKGHKTPIGEGGEAIHVLAGIEGVSLEMRKVELGPWTPTTVEDALRD